jgi:hypothetical protein
MMRKRIQNWWDDTQPPLPDGPKYRPMPRVGQRKTASLLEVCVSTAMGFGIAYLTTMLVFPVFGIHTPWDTNLVITSIFTIVSVVRSYLFRRMFNWLHVKGVL